MSLVQQKIYLILYSSVIKKFGTSLNEKLTRVVMLRISNIDNFVYFIAIKSISRGISVIGLSRLVGKQFNKFFKRLSKLSYI